MTVVGSGLAALTQCSGTHKATPLASAGLSAASRLALGGPDAGDQA